MATALGEMPATIPVTVLVSPLAFESTSVSLVKTLPVPFEPVVALLTPPASTASLLSTMATGLSLDPWIVIVTVATEVAPAVSAIVYVNVSLSVWLVNRSACTEVFVLSTVYVYDPSEAMLIEPYVPVTLKPTEPAAVACEPATTPVTVLVSPFPVLSTSVSLVSTLPIGVVPVVPLETPPASTAVLLSLPATGVSFNPVIVTVICVEPVKPSLSVTV